MCCIIVCSNSVSCLKFRHTFHQMLGDLRTKSEGQFTHKVHLILKAEDSTG